jgi:hypothetical protein
MKVTRRSTLWVDLSLTGLCIGLAVGFGLQHRWLNMFMVIVLAFIPLLSRARARWTYRNGWWDGRLEMLASMEEAQERGLDAEEWISSQVEKEAYLAADKHWPVI